MIVKLFLRRYGGATMSAAAAGQRTSAACPRMLRACSSVRMPKSRSTGRLDLLEGDHLPLQVAERVGEVHAEHDVLVLQRRHQGLVVVPDAVHELLGESSTSAPSGRRCRHGSARMRSAPGCAAGCPSPCRTGPSAPWPPGAGSVTMIWPRSCRMPATYTSSRMSPGLEAARQHERIEGRAVGVLPQRLHLRVLFSRGSAGRRRCTGGCAVPSSRRSSPPAGCCSPGGAACSGPSSRASGGPP